MDLVLPVFVTFLSIQIGRALLVTGIASLWVRHGAGALSRRIYRVPLAPRQSRSELRAGIAVLIFDAAVGTAFFYFGWIVKAAPGIANTALSFALMFAWYEIWFYATHRLIHTRPLYGLHRQHHTARVTQPLTALSFSLGERAVLLGGALGFAAAVSRLVPISQSGLVLYFMVNLVLNTLGHSNVETFPRGFATSYWAKFAISPTWHAMHHARIKGHYGLFTPFLDRAFGTAFPDYPAVFDRAVSGLGLHALEQRMEKPSELRTERTTLDSK